MISTHVLDTSAGTPGAGIAVSLQKPNGSGWEEIEKGSTNADGRVNFQTILGAGTYQLVYDVEAYLKKGGRGFYTQIPIVFKVEEINRKYHIPLLLNPFGYTTYRGS